MSNRLTAAARRPARLIYTASARFPPCGSAWWERFGSGFDRTCNKHCSDIVGEPKNRVKMANVGQQAPLILHRITATGSRAAAPLMGRQALVSSLRGRTDCHSPGTPGHGARSRTHPTVERQAGSPDNSARPRWARSAGTHRWCGLQAPSRRAPAMSTNRPAPDAAGGAAAGGRAVCGVCFVPL